MSDTTEKPASACAACEFPTGKKICFTESGSGSKGCPTLIHKDLLKEARALYEESEVFQFARNASIQEGECYTNKVQNPFVLEPTKTRIVEICEFARKMGYKRLGLAFCIGLANEAAVVNKIFANQGFDVVSVICKAGGELKEGLGIDPKNFIMPPLKETMCNPIFQAKLLNAEKTEFNVLLGLCVGHDSLFFKHADAYTTVLAVKDRVTGHNPLAAIYLSHSYYGKIMSKP
ncbi:MAG: DUF1847 domain-containing protein [Proteobacteria bacterium]|nr:DUF1847 domain-containing protein [Pseudomonadota bacterium]MBU4472245.1 DUF1847 domain-containing protein [Pseudomonadota bacterium]MCG2751940.1 DUF1847 domain-containing protein [Desulfobacteraceae bacterium]